MIIVALLVFIQYSRLVNSYCTPSNSSCWPTDDDIKELRRDVSGIILVPNDGIIFEEYCKPKNEIISTRPYFILLPGRNSISDIQKSIEFIRQHNLLLSIFSTGHSYIGRSEGKYNDSFQINFKDKTNIEYNYNNDNGEDRYLESLTMETGVNLEQIYTSLNQINTLTSNTDYCYLFTGGDCHTVAIGGFLMGGGHSPLSAYLGLGMDKVYEFELITSNGSYVRANENENSDLFWALRGGGGGTFGIVLNITVNVTKLAKKLNGMVLQYYLCNIHFILQKIKIQIKIIQLI